MCVQFATIPTPDQTTPARIATELRWFMLKAAQSTVLSEIRRDAQIAKMKYNMTGGSLDGAEIDYYMMPKGGIYKKPLLSSNKLTQSDDSHKVGITNSCEKYVVTGHGEMTFKGYS